jgi:hypothetical protein
LKLATANIETGPKFRKHRTRQTLREGVPELGGHRYVQNTDITDGNRFLDEVKVDLDMLCALVLNEIGEEIDGTDIVIVYESALQQQNMELLDELSEPTSFSHTVGHDAILSLGARAGD